MSPSSRRAWIEIVKMDGHTAGTSVALLAEGVDRNLCGGVPPRNGWRSPSSRRAWIEILYRPKWEHTEYVALLAEGVDRNGSLSDKMVERLRRPPCGGRG